MRPILFVCALLTGGVAVAASHDPAPPTRPQVSGEARAEHWRYRLLDQVYRPIDRDRQNVGAMGRVNATRDEQQVAETPSLQPAPLTMGTTW